MEKKPKCKGCEAAVKVDGEHAHGVAIDTMRGERGDCEFRTSQFDTRACEGEPNKVRIALTAIDPDTGNGMLLAASFSPEAARRAAMALLGKANEAQRLAERGGLTERRIEGSDLN